MISKERKARIRRAAKFVFGSILLAWLFFVLAAKGQDGQVGNLEQNTSSNSAQQPHQRNFVAQQSGHGEHDTSEYDMFSPVSTQINGKGQGESSFSNPVEHPVFSSGDTAEGSLADAEVDLFKPANEGEARPGSVEKDIFADSDDDPGLPSKPPPPQAADDKPSKPLHQQGVVKSVPKAPAVRPKVAAVKPKPMTVPVVKNPVKAALFKRASSQAKAYIPSTDRGSTQIPLKDRARTRGDATEAAATHLAGGKDTEVSEAETAHVQSRADTAQSNSEEGQRADYTVQLRPKRTRAVNKNRSLPLRKQRQATPAPLFTEPSSVSALTKAQLLQAMSQLKKRLAKPTLQRIAVNARKNSAAFAKKGGTSWRETGKVQALQDVSNKVMFVTFANTLGNLDRTLVGKNLCPLIKSCVHNRILLHVIGWGTGQQTNDVDKKIKNFHAEALATFLETLPPSQIVMIMDGYDVQFVAPEDEILERFLAFGSPIVFSAEINCYPADGVLDRYPAAPTRFKFLNFGGFMGYAGHVAKVLRGLEGYFASGAARNDQHAAHFAYLDGHYNITLDYFQQLWGSLVSVCKGPENVYTWADGSGRPLNRATNVKPAMIHFNGPGRRCVRSW
eukprot:CAMPEP_0184656442 /NCGR_PEP_ID=MMETSP0308-20130426/16508_1 /TAXON_ID=38269 /ORGANISM="Gloeochaete witrockiana, Strain SAG 46.84" /LENGTH=616 /DNA_ID=CAMNT_0027093579 /DNA_START=133 /DNA_END=1980 /DNA_ORIENTATION=+